MLVASILSGNKPEKTMADLSSIENRTPPSTRMQRAEGEGRLKTQTRNGETCIANLFQEGCAKIRLPRTHSPALEAVLINTSGGLTGGDRLNWHIKATEGANLTLTTQACERIYKSTGDDAHVSTLLEIGKNAHVDWLPQETILFEQSRLNRSMHIKLSQGASFTGVEAILLGREAMGETARSAILSDRWDIRRNGRLLHLEANKLSATDLERESLSLLAGNRAFATIIHIAEDAETKLAAVRALIGEGVKAAVSAIGERLIVRVLATSGLALRRIITPIIAYLSGAGALPRLWST